ncbi:hypothetical protein ACIQUQ_32580 [Streptomyces sp. NPDC101118]|uniref:hypothetical protein n=1 Tax=Streptomyces sp. NPDC101118 TaxID=3366109 RepID=UPI0037FCC411
MNSKVRFRSADEQEEQRNRCWRAEALQIAVSFLEGSRRERGFKKVPGVRSESVLPGVSVMSPPVEQPDKKYPAHDDVDGHGTTMTAAIVGDGSGGAPKGLAPRCCRESSA